MLNSHPVEYLDITVDDLVASLLGLAETEAVCVLDSSGVSHLGSHVLIAGIDPVRTVEHSSADPSQTLEAFDKYLSSGLAAVFTISYELGRRLLAVGPPVNAPATEPDLFVALFDVLIIHDYSLGTTRLAGNAEKFSAIRKKLIAGPKFKPLFSDSRSVVRSDLTRNAYLDAIFSIKERIRRGDTYQTNLTQNLTVDLAVGLTPATVFHRLRSSHPAPFSAYIGRSDSTVVSASPERFFRIDRGTIQTSPIKGTRPRGASPSEDNAMRHELLTSSKDRAENTMIVDLIRNDLGRVCEYGSVKVEKLCALEEHPSLFHLVSTISGTLRDEATLSDVLRALFPCGSITGAPKISTMRIIDEIERSTRGLSMGAIGYYVPPGAFGIPATIDTSVAIRTMVIRDGRAVFNVGGGIVIDSDPQAEYDESLTKASALLVAINGELKN